MSARSPVLLRTTPPTVTDDASTGVYAGLQWLDTVTRRLYACSSAAVGAAVWTAVGAALAGWAWTEHAFEIVDPISFVTSNGTLV